MSIERMERKAGVVWRVRWRDERGRNRSKVLGRKRDAEAFDAEVRRLKRTRELGQLDAGKQTLAEFGQDWWTLHAEPQLAKVTLELYAMLWDVHILPRLGDLKLRDLTAEEIQRFRVDLEAAGVGPVSIRKALTLLHGILQRAVEWDASRLTPPRRSESRRRNAPGPSNPCPLWSWSASAVTCKNGGGCATRPSSPSSPTQASDPEKRSRSAGRTSASTRSSSNAPPR